jgi:hypothetical protein
MRSNEGVGSSPTTPDITDADVLIGLPRLIHHVRENNVAYLVGMLISYQIGLFQFLQTQAGGMC